MSTSAFLTPSKAAASNSQEENTAAVPSVSKPYPYTDKEAVCEFCGRKKVFRFQRYLKCSHCTLRPLSPVSITRLRTLMCMTQEEFGRQLGVTRLCVWNWENGLRIPHDRHRRLLLKLAQGNKVEMNVYEKRDAPGIAKEPEPV